MNNELLNQAFNFVKSKDKSNPYHNYKHIHSVWERVVKNPLFKTLSDREQFCLQMAAIFHDAAHSATNTEEVNLKLAVECLKKFNQKEKILTDDELELVISLIHSTDNQRLTFILEDEHYVTRAILKDADVTQTISEDDYWRKCLSEEMGTEPSVGRDIEFFSSIRLFTPYGMSKFEWLKEFAKKEKEKD